MIAVTQRRTDARTSGTPIAEPTTASRTEGLRGKPFADQEAMLDPAASDAVQMSALAGRDAGATAGMGAAETDVPHHGRPGASAPRAVQRKEESLDRTELEADGADAALAPAKVQAAITANNKRWKGGYRKELLAYLRDSADAAGDFTAEDIQVVVQIQQGAGAGADGIIGDSTMAVLLHAGLAFSAEAGVDKAHPGGKPKASEVKLEFWPGELEDMDAWRAAIDEANQAAAAAKAAGSDDESACAPMRNLTAPPGVGKIYVKVAGNVVAKYDARGGPPAKILDIGGHTADPTQGTYTVGAQQKGFTTKAWPASQIGWDAKIRQGAGGAYEYAAAGTTKWMKVPANIQSDIDWYWTNDKLNPDPSDPKARRYNQNDFGAMAYRLTGSPGFYIHTTPETELQAAEGQPVELSHSHGCVHVNPNERDEMIARGYLAAGVTFACKKYDANLLPKAAREKLM